MTTNSLIYNEEEQYFICDMSEPPLLSYEAKTWIEDTFDRALFNVVWENDEPVSLIVTVHYNNSFHLSKGKTLVEIRQELEEWQNNGYPTREVE